MNWTHLNEMMGYEWLVYFSSMSVPIGMCILKDRLSTVVCQMKKRIVVVAVAQRRKKLRENYENVR
jgi:hypothetical protein